MKRVLIVDDSAYIRGSLKEMLEKSGYNIAGEASNGMVAIKMYKVLKPDIVAIDISRPELGGIEAIQMIRLMDVDARVIVLSSGQEYLAEKAIMAGAIAFIVKPFEEETVYNTFKNAFPIT